MGRCVRRTSFGSKCCSDFAWARVRELSVSLPSIPLVKSKVRECALPEAEVLAKQVLELNNGTDVRELEKKVQKSLK